MLILFFNQEIGSNISDMSSIDFFNGMESDKLNLHVDLKNMIKIKYDFIVQRWINAYLVFF